MSRSQFPYRVIKEVEPDPPRVILRLSCGHDRVYEFPAGAYERGLRILSDRAGRRTRCVVCWRLRQAEKKGGE